MQIIDLTDEYKELYFICLEDWSSEMSEAGNHKACWYEKMKDKGLRVKLALDDKGVAGGMIQYVPIEFSVAEGSDAYFILCIWVHGHKQGRGNFQKRGLGKALLAAAEEDARQLGAQGMAAWGVALPFWMKAAWYKKRGYTIVDKDGIARLLWKPFTPDALSPVFIKQRKTPQPVAGKVTVTAFLNGNCCSQNIVYERARRAAGELGEKVVFHSIDTFERATFLEWGLSDALFIDNKQVNTGPPPKYEQIKKLIAKQLRKVR